MDEQPFSCDQATAAREWFREHLFMSVPQAESYRNSSDELTRHSALDAPTGGTRKLVCALKWN